MRKFTLSLSLASLLLIAVVPLAALAEPFEVYIDGCPTSIHRGEVLSFTAEVFNPC